MTPKVEQLELDFCPYSNLQQLKKPYQISADSQLPSYPTQTNYLNLTYLSYLFSHYLYHPSPKKHQHSKRRGKY
uniref:Uncharacterized protein n=1 Tax=Manihot esculenta TaxID=3983 RepID=A0A2C9UXH4_MANES